MNKAFFAMNPMPRINFEHAKEDTDDLEQLVIEPAEKYNCTNCSKVFQKPGVLVTIWLKPMGTRETSSFLGVQHAKTLSMYTKSFLGT